MISLTYTDNGLSVNLAKAPQVTSLQLQKWMTQVVAHVHAVVARNIGDGGLIGRRTGNLARAIMDRVAIEGGQVIGEVWPDPSKVAYGAIQEFGGTVVPKHGQYLTIPIDAMLTSNGVARGTAAQVRDNPGGFGFTGTFVAKGVIFGKEGTGKRASIIPLFALKRSVVIPAHNYLDVTFQQELTWIMDALERIAQESVSLIFGDDGDAYA